MGKIQQPTQNLDYSEDDRSSPELESLNCCQLKVHQKKILRNRRKHPLDPTYNGPLKNRSCTDIICLLLFLVFIAAWVALGIYSYSSGSPGEIFAPKDSLYRKCGYDASVADKPELVFFDLTTCIVPNNGLFHCNTPQVCVKECPTEDFYFDAYISSDVSANYIAKKLICQPDVITENLTKEDLKKLVDGNKCARWYLKSTPVAHRCLPDLSTLVDSFGSIVITIHDETGGIINTTVNGVSTDQLNEASYVVQAISAVNEFWQAVAKDLIETWPWIIICIGGAMLLSFFYIIVMRWIAGIVVWFSLIASIALFAYCSYISWIKYDELRNVDQETKSSRYLIVKGTAENPSAPVARRVKITRDNDIGNIIQDQVDSYLRMKTTWLVFFIISVTILAILLILIIFLRNRIRLAISLINEGSRAVAHSWSTLFFPILPWLIQIGVICYGVSICLYLFSSGVSVTKVAGLANDANCKCSNNYKDGDYCLESAFASYCHDNGGPCTTAACMVVVSESHDFTIYLQLYNLFVFFWAMFFVGAVGKMILASTFATYYFTFDKNDIPFFIVLSSAWRVFRYHLGTAAFGSLLLAIVSWLRALLELSSNYLKKYDNGFVRAVKCCLRCFFWCLEKFLKFLNKNAYIMCAIHGKNFCTSAKDAFTLLLSNIVRVVVLDKVTDFLFFVSKLVISAAVGAASFYIFSKPVVNLQDLEGAPYQSSYTFVPIVFTVIGTYFIASIFFSVYATAVDTLFLCFLEDCKENDGSKEKPYFMSKSLMSILGKKNKKTDV